MSITATELRMGCVAMYEIDRLDQIAPYDELAEPAVAMLREGIDSWQGREEKVVRIFEAFLEAGGESKQVFKDFVAELLTGDKRPVVEKYFAEYFSEGTGTDYWRTETCFVKQAARLALESGESSEKELEGHLRRLAEVGSMNLLGDFLDKGVNPNARDAKGRTAIHRAARWGFVDVIDALKDAGASVKALDYKGRTALHYAYRKPKAIRYLAEAGADVSAADLKGDKKLVKLVNDLSASQRLSKIWERMESSKEGGRTPLFLAVLLGNPKSCKALVEAKADLEAGGHFDDWSRLSPLAVAIYEDALDIADYLIESGADTKTLSTHRDGRKASLMSLAAYSENTQALAFLLSKGLPLDEESSDSPIIWAVSEGDIDTVTWLLDHDASPNTCNAKGETVLSMAVKKEEGSELAELLLARGAKPTEKEAPELLKFAIDKQPICLVEALVKAGISPDTIVKPDGGWGALTWAAKKGHWDIVERLLVLGADPNSRGNHSILHRAVAAKKEHLVRLLVEKKIHINNIHWTSKQGISDTLCKTALHQAIDQGSLPLVKLLVELGADPAKPIRIKDRWGQYSDGITPIKLAQQCKQKEIQEYLAEILLDRKLRD